MLISQAFSSKYLAASDLKGRQVKATIASVEEAQFGDKKKIVIFFENKEKGMICNLTNAMFLAEALGDDTDNWSGQEVVLYSARVMFKDKLVDGLRIKLPPQQPAARKVAGTVNGQPILDDPRTQAPVDIDGEEIPF